MRNVRPWLILDAVQSFEYAISHLLDKATESLFGYIPVLPGAVSMYRWCAIRGEPLAAYFTIEEIPVKELGAFLANMYLAEVRAGVVGGAVITSTRFHGNCSRAAVSFGCLCGCSGASRAWAHSRWQLIVCFAHAYA